MANQLVAALFVVSLVAPVVAVLAGLLALAWQAPRARVEHRSVTARI